MRTVLVSRPRHQQKHFVDLCQAIGLATVSLPLLSIKAIKVDDAHWQPHLNKPDVAWIFTSRNAVLHCPFNDVPVGPVFAMGASTMQALEASGRSVAIAPEVPFDSEALIAQLREYNIKDAVVVTGVGGRAWLADTLKSMNWSVVRLDCYQRLPVVHAPHTVIGALNASDVLSLTSIESMDALFVSVAKAKEFMQTRPLAPKLDDAWQEKPLIVNSQRAVDAAREAKFTGPILVAVPAGDAGQIQALESWLATTL